MSRTARLLVLEYQGHKLISPQFGYIIEEVESREVGDLAAELSATWLGLAASIRPVEGDGRWLEVPLRDDNTIAIRTYKINLISSVLIHGAIGLSCFAGPRFDAEEARVAQAGIGLADPDLPK